MQNAETREEKSANRDPISGAPGAHPVGTGLGAALGGAAAGAVTGTMAGPVGTVIGAAAGAILGGLAGKGVAETIDPTAESAYWRENFTERPYVGSGASFDDYGPAYDYGVQSSTKYADRDFDDVASDLGRDWGSARGASNLSWEHARDASRDSWERARLQRDDEPLVEFRS